MPKKVRILKDKFEEIFSEENLSTTRKENLSVRKKENLSARKKENSEAAKVSGNNPNIVKKKDTKKENAAESTDSLDLKPSSSKSFNSMRYESDPEDNTYLGRAGAGASNLWSGTAGRLASWATGSSASCTSTASGRTSPLFTTASEEVKVKDAAAIARQCSAVMFLKVE